MKHEEKMAKIIRRELDQELAFLDSRPSLHHDIMCQIKGEKIVKKKLSVGLILALVLLLAGTAALAASLLWQDYVPQMKQTEQEMGRYNEWPAAMRIQLAKDIVEMGYVQASGEVAVLSDPETAEQEQAEAADQLMLALTGKSSVEEIGSTTITYALMGHEDTWTPEQRVWWNGIVNMYSDTGAPDTLVVPTADDLPEEEAVVIARAAIMEAYGFTEEEMARLHPVANLYVTEQRPHYKRWDIQFKQYREGSTTYVERVYSAIVDEQGQVIADPDVGALHPADNAARSQAIAQEEANMPDYERKYIEYMETLGGNHLFWDWSYEVKAAYYADVYPMVADLEVIESIQVGASTFYAYGLPEETDVQYDAAVELARRVLADEYGMTDEQISGYSYMLEAFDVTNPNQRLWKFVFINPDDTFGIRYRVLLNAENGKVVLHESYPWQQIDHGAFDEYTRKLY